MTTFDAIMACMAIGLVIIIGGLGIVAFVLHCVHYFSRSRS